VRDSAAGRNDWYGGGKEIRSTDPLGLAPIYGDDIRGQAIAVFPREDLKKDTSIKIERTGSTGYYSDTLKVNIRNQTAYSAPVQSTADMPEPRLSELNGKTLSTGDYKGLLLSKSYSYENAIQLTGDFFIHPDQFTTPEKKAERQQAGLPIGPFTQPYSAGCQIMHLGDFNILASTLEGIGFDYNNKDTIDVSIEDISAKKGK